MSQQILTEALIKAHSGQYDVEVVQRLHLDRLGLSSLGGSSLGNCLNLLDLSLAGNNLTSTAGLSTLLTLRRLNLSYNKIKRIDDGLQDLQSLTHLDLRGNAIAEVFEVQNLMSLVQLQSLYFQSGTTGTGDSANVAPSSSSSSSSSSLAVAVDANPMCSHAQYFQLVTTSLPALTILDGALVGVIEASKLIEDSVKNVKPDEDVLAVPLPLDSWFLQADLQVGDKDEAAAAVLQEFIGGGNKQDDVVAFAGGGGGGRGGGVYAPAIASHDRCVETLRLESTTLLRKSAAVLSKAD